MADEAARLPRHVAIIMDGNGRWARQHRLAVALGHRQGVEALRAVIRRASDLGIEVLSLYAFSRDNWRRPAQEVSALMGLVLEFFSKEIDELNRNGVKIRILGEKAAFPAAQQAALKRAEAVTAGNRGLMLNIALNYGGREEIVRAARGLAEDARDGRVDPQAIDQALFRERLYTQGQPDVDLLIRTSGEMRLSDFLLYQNAYAELVFPQVLWPDFTVAHFDEALAAFGRRSRRFGGR